MKIYTKTGDAGQTGLFGGPRIGKDDPRIEAYGAVDELNAALGLAQRRNASAGNRRAIGPHSESAFRPWGRACHAKARGTWDGGAWPDANCCVGAGHRSTRGDVAAARRVHFAGGISRRRCTASGANHLPAGGAAIGDAGGHFSRPDFAASGGLFEPAWRFAVCARSGGECGRGSRRCAVAKSVGPDRVALAAQSASAVGPVGRLSRAVLGTLRGSDGSGEPSYTRFAAIGRLRFPVAHVYRPLRPFRPLRSSLSRLAWMRFGWQESGV